MEVNWSSELKEKINNIPDNPGCYLMRDENGYIIYIGKAASLKKRLKSYFRPYTFRNGTPKQRSLIKSIQDFDIIILRSNDEAILTEGQLIKKYQPYYNVLWKDDKNFQYIRININCSPPTVNLSRIKDSDSCFYFGPYIKSRVAKLAIKYIEKFFGFKMINKNNKLLDNSSSSNDLRIKFQIPELDNLSYSEKEKFIDEISKFLKGYRIDLINKLSLEMSYYSNRKDYESAAEIRDLIRELNKTAKEKINNKKSLSIIKNDLISGLDEIKKILKLQNTPNTIECFDISNISGTNSVGSMVVAKKGIPSPKYYKRFKINTIEGINDPKSIGEVIRRRYKRVKKENLSFPNLIIVDGGITQLKAAVYELKKLNLQFLPIIGLAKKYEEIIWDIENKEPPIILEKNSNGLKILTLLRDESHRFAINYHRNIRNKKTLQSTLDFIPSIGTYKKEKLLSHFGSLKKIEKASISSLSNVEGIGLVTAELIFNELRKIKNK